jgi:hypothetical protein
LAGLACTPKPSTTESSGSGGSAGNGGTGRNGGSSGNGGTTGSGGSSGNGGTTSSGGSSGRTTGSGGSSGNGGTTSSGGSTGNGGKTGAGGSGSGGKGGSGGAGNGGMTRAGGSGSGVGGSAGSGGKGGSGVTTGNGGSAGMGGASGMGSSTGTGASTGSCTFTQTSSISPKIGTVGIVKWSTSQSGLTSAHIDFGLDTNYGMTAPVPSPVAGENTTLLLGMKQSKTYHYRLTATTGSGDCSSSDYTIATTTLASGLPKITVTTKNKTALFGGFLVTGQFLQTGGGSPSYILDADGDMVWAYSTSKDVTGATMDYAGTHMWINAANVPSGAASVRRVTMDGQKEEDLSSQFAGLNHQLTVLPDETVAFYAYNSSTGCDDIKEYSPSGTVKTIVNAKAAEGTNPTACHINNVQYSKDDDTLVFSDLDNQVVVKIKRSDGSTVWALNGTNPTITGDSWKGGEHGLHVLAVDHVMVFNNNSRNIAGGMGSAGGDGSGSIAIELKLDLTAKKVTKSWSYKSADGIQNDVMGDLQRLPNGNTIVAYSTQGVLHEVDASGAVLQTLEWPLGASFGYIQKRATLYGPPPR